MMQLPAAIVTLATFLVELSHSSPVYNMQPAFITTNIGSTGRNIRNLPCISRKTNQSGICMFAIDCLKSNGTHLGTCIDRFYFGSCCHIEPLTDIIENTIDTDIIPAREPPLRISSTLKPITTTKISLSSTTTTTNTPTTTKSSSTTATIKQTTTKMNVTTPKSTTTTTTTTTTTKPTTSLPSTTPSTASTTIKTIITSSKPAEEATTLGYKLTTFQTVQDVVIETTNKPLSTFKPKPSTSWPSKPKPTKPKPSQKPIKITSSTNSISSTTRRTSTRKPISTTTKKPQLSTRTTTATTFSNRLTTTKPTTTTRTTTTTPTTKKVISTTSNSPTKISSTTSSTLQNEISINKINTSSAVDGVSGNIVTNEIEGPSSNTKEPLTSSSTTTSKPSMVTWMEVDNKKNISTTIATTVNATGEEWRPITTPDGWVLLPSVAPNISTSSPSSTAPLSNSTSPILSLTLPAATSTESASNSSITNIPLESTTFSATLNGSSEETITPAVATPTTSPPSPPLDFKPVNMSDFTDVCGRRMYPEARIVGGEKSYFGKWPWQISLRQWRTSTYLHKCGAALLNENWAITAAHCVDNVPPSDLLLRLGEHDLSTESEPYLHQERRVQIVASHPQFDPRTFEYDLALLRFYEPVTFQPNILPVCIPHTDENFVGRTAYVTGWGRLYEDGPLPSILQEVSVPVINNTVCESMYRAAGYIEHIPHIFICAGWRRGGFDSCEGDSGGPMVIQREDKRFMLAGVISWGIGCAEPNQPGVYTRISDFRDWINQILQF